MFRGHIRRSGSLRSAWHRRERKRRPLGQLPALAEPQNQTHRYRHNPTEADWQSGAPSTMLRCLVGLTSARGIVFHLPRTAVQRKLRLFYCACAREKWELLPGAARLAVELIERYANGQANAKHLRAARRTAEILVRAVQPHWPPGGYPPGAWDAANATRLVVSAAEIHARLRHGYIPTAEPVGDADQAYFLRELFGNPFHPVELEAGWLTPTAVNLAHEICARRAFDQMPVLGDALQDAGCARPEVLEHCYGAGPHAAGDWLLDLLTGW